MLHIRCKNNNITKSFPEGTSLADVYQAFASELNFKYPVVSAKVNNASQGLKFRLYQNRDVEFLDARSGSGRRVYTRSLCFVLYKATSDVFPGSKLYMEHPISNGYYCNFKKKNNEPLTDEDVQKICQRMKEIVDLDLPFRRTEATTDEAVRVFSERGFADKVKLIETSGQIYTDYYMLGDTVDYYYGPLVPSAGFLKVWGLERYHDGLLLRVPDKNDPTKLAEKVDMPRTFEVFAEKVRWDIIMRLSNAGDVNKAILRGYGSELIQVSEALQEKKIVKIAEEIDQRFRDPENPIRIVLITGPSSSGKSTFCKRLSVQLLACGLRPYSFSTDDYFVNRVDTPKLPNGQYDFDNIETVDYKLLGEHLERLMKGEVVEVPQYNFVTGKREWNGKKFKLSNDSVLIIEGIHALNPLLTKQIPDSAKYKIYISALTSISLDDHNWIPTQDNRLLRRIIRDYNKGAFSARETISQWHSVCEAEDQWIVPFQETADVMFNSALNIEFAVLRTHAEVILASVPKNCPEYAEAHRLLKFLHYFIPISDKEIPPTSIMREFVGGSSFKYRG
ncbi:uridine kinase [Xylanibacter ruminicola]|jgi:uridine kinase|uniref:Phosphoribulokinase/uridine kinase family protein n=2 Tax=Xylanibacter ruminicola TaxID=839 RepID=D5EXA9_XYLR2|nr:MULTISPECIES: nucleoside kinase [Prevotellaceae]MBP3248586.1 nucleoside kinase [Prevotella sp.]ADE83049.1 phosphoribulokinase/uridine kinase family protein [Xylanibacter ruminicola 23]QVJ79675.1 nucleoside kinase [Xylanibacter ruminicola]SDQ36369.1 uridine kinase [Prevotella sp. khp1]SEH85193.1 uridine kinase [Xylanibacter ruminicola]